MDERVKYWLDLADYDFDTAEAMLLSGRYLYVGFMCHQTIEKVLKAYFVFYKQNTAIYTQLVSSCQQSRIIGRIDGKVERDHRLPGAVKH